MTQPKVRHIPSSCQKAQAETNLARGTGIYPPLCDMVEGNLKLNEWSTLWLCDRFDRMATALKMSSEIHNLLRDQKTQLPHVEHVKEKAPWTHRVKDALPSNPPPELLYGNIDPHTGGVNGTGVVRSGPNGSWSSRKAMIVTISDYCVMIGDSHTVFKVLTPQGRTSDNQESFYLSSSPSVRPVRGPGQQPVRE
jgi:hypothetical protein